MNALQKPQNLIPLKKSERQGAKFSRNEAYLTYAAWTGKLKHKSAGQPICTAEGNPEGVASKDGRHARRRSGFFSGIMDATYHR